MTADSTLYGQTLANRYQIEHRIGSGGQADVFVGTDTASGWRRAIKLLPTSFNTPADAIERFKQETLLVANLPVHDNIIQVYDGGYDGTLRAFYIIMELSSGATLQTLIDGGDGNPAPPREQTIVRDVDNPLPPHEEAHEGGPGCPPPVAVALVRQIARGLHHAHQQGIVHRDVKPANVLINRDGEVKLTDFGIARIAVDVSLTVTGKAVGTQHYMSPEQIQDLDNLDHRSDLYALGVVLYECLTGRTPFAHVQTALVPHYQVREPVPPPRELNPTIPVELEEIVLRALAKHPQDRFQSAEEMEQALASLVSERIVEEAGPEEVVRLLEGHLPEEEELSAREEKVSIDSGDRCPRCGAPLPLILNSDPLEECPSCFLPLTETRQRSNAVIHDLIKQARDEFKVEYGQRVGFDMARHIYDTWLQAPLFQQWRETTEEGAKRLTKGTVIIPPNEEDETGLLEIVRQLMQVADQQTDPELQEYNLRMAERHESAALSAQARANAFQLLGRRHTIVGARATAPEEATESYRRANHAFKEAVRYYEEVLEEWDNYEQGPSHERIEGYYSLLREDIRGRLDWAQAAEQLSEGILTFPHQHQRAYEHFDRAEGKLQPLQSRSGAAVDLEAVQAYDHYYEKTLDSFVRRQQTISDSQDKAEETIEKLYRQDQELVAADQNLVQRWWQRRKAIATDFSQKAEDLPALRQRWRIVTPLVVYLGLLILWLVHLPQLSSSAQVLTNFWSAWPLLLWQSLGYSLSLGAFHQPLVLLLGLDLLLIFPLNVMIKRRLQKYEWTENLLPFVPAPSQFLLPIYDWLYQLRVEEADGLLQRALQLLALLLERLAPWWALILLLAALRDVTGNRVFALYSEWWLFLLIVPQLGGYWIGTVLNKIDERLQTLKADEMAALNGLDAEVAREREELNTRRDRLAQEAREQSLEVHKTFTLNMASIKKDLSIFLARLLYYHEAGEFVDIPGLQRAMERWRERMDGQFLNRMGLEHRQVLSATRPTVEPLGTTTWEPVWEPARQLRRIESEKQKSVRVTIQFPEEGTILWGVDGLEQTQRVRLQPAEGERYAATVEVPADASQLNFLFATAENRWFYEPHTIWIG